MTWAELGWPELSPEFAEPRPSEMPRRPEAPEDIGERVEAAERRRARAVKRCALVGTILVGVGLWAEVAGARALGVALMAVGLAVAFALAAYFAWTFGPTWEQRQQHWAVLRWEREMRLWRERERARYLASLTPRQRERFRQVVEAAERRRARAVKCCALVGTILVGVGLWAEVAGAQALGVALMAVGLAVAFALATYYAWAFGPTWEQRQQHWAILRWEREMRLWRERERARYLASLTPRQRERFRQVVDA